MANKSDIRCPWVLSDAGSKPVKLSGERPRYRKDAIRVGRFVARNPVTGEDLAVEATPARLQRWADTFARMRSAGNRIDLTVDHKRGAEAVRGDVVAMAVEGDRLYFETEPSDGEAEKLIQRCPQVSIEFEPQYKDGAGNVYEDAITAVSVCRKPVVTGQEPFRVAASLDHDGRTTDMPVVWFSRQPATDDPDNDPADPKRSPDMFSKEQRETLITKLGLDPKADDKAIAEKVMLSLDAPAKLTETEASLATANEQIEELKVKLSNAEGSQPIKLSRDVQGVLEEAVDAKVDGLVDSRRLTPAAADKLRKSLKTGGATMLSREANGGEQSRAMGILDAVKENDPVELAKLAGEKTGPQGVALSRDQLDDGNGKNPLLDDANSRRATAGMTN